MANLSNIKSISIRGNVINEFDSEYPTMDSTNLNTVPSTRVVLDLIKEGTYTVNNNPRFFNRVWNLTESDKNPDENRPGELIFKLSEDIDILLIENVVSDFIDYEVRDCYIRPEEKPENIAVLNVGRYRYKELYIPEEIIYSGTKFIPRKICIEETGTEYETHPNLFSYVESIHAPTIRAFGRIFCANSEGLYLETPEESNETEETRKKRELSLIMINDSKPVIPSGDDTFNRKRIDIKCDMFAGVFSTSDSERTKGIGSPVELNIVANSFISLNQTTVEYGSRLISTGSLLSSVPYNFTSVVVPTGTYALGITKYNLSTERFYSQFLNPTCEVVIPEGCQCSSNIMEMKTSVDGENVLNIVYATYKLIIMNPEYTKILMNATLTQQIPTSKNKFLNTEDYMMDFPYRHHQNVITDTNFSRDLEDYDQTYKLGLVKNKETKRFSYTNRCVSDRVDRAPTTIYFADTLVDDEMNKYRNLVDLQRDYRAPDDSMSNVSSGYNNYTIVRSGERIRLMQGTFDATYYTGAGFNYNGDAYLGTAPSDVIADLKTLYFAGDDSGLYNDIGATVVSDKFRYVSVVVDTVFTVPEGVTLVIVYTEDRLILDVENKIFLKHFGTGPATFNISLSETSKMAFSAERGTTMYNIYYPVPDLSKVIFDGEGTVNTVVLADYASQRDCGLLTLTTTVGRMNVRNLVLGTNFFEGGDITGDWTAATVTNVYIPENLFRPQAFRAKTKMNVTNVYEYADYFDWLGTRTQLS